MGQRSQQHISSVFSDADIRYQIQGQHDAPNRMLLGRKSQQQIDGQGHRHMDCVLEEILLAAQGAQNSV